MFCTVCNLINSTFIFRKIAFISCFHVPYFHVLHFLRNGGGRVDPNPTNGSSSIVSILLLVESSLWVPHPPICKLLKY